MITPIWAWGADPEGSALAEARRRGMSDPVVARTVQVNGSHFAGVTVIVADTEDEAEAHRQARRRDRPRWTGPRNGNGGSE